MNEGNSGNSSSPREGASFSVVSAIVISLIGAAFLSAHWFTGNEKLWDVGLLVIGIGIPFILLWILQKAANVYVIRLFRLMRKENLQEIVKDRKQGKELITNCFSEWARGRKGTIKVKGVTLNLIFGNSGILKELIRQNGLSNLDSKKVQALLLNPYSMNAITRSIQEGRTFMADPEPLEAICKHTLKKHKGFVLYEDFKRTVENVRDLVSDAHLHGITVECRIYSALSPCFLLISDRRAIMENLILGRKRSQTAKKLYGLLPHLVYGPGDIKESLESHFDYMWKYDSIPLEDFHEEVEEKYYEINRLFLLYRLQKEVWEEQWRSKARSPDSKYDMLYQGYKEHYPDFSPTTILDLGCGDGGGGSLTILKEHPGSRIDFVDISEAAIDMHLKPNIATAGMGGGNYRCHASDMLTFLNRCQPRYYSLVHANYSIIYMTKIKAIEIYRRIFDTLQSGGIFMLSLWTTEYFTMPVAEHGVKGHRPPHVFVRVAMTEDLRVLSDGSDKRIGEIRRFYRGYEELLEEFRIANKGHTMDLENIKHDYAENGAILRVWVRKR